jgi:hypothetical protein
MVEKPYKGAYWSTKDLEDLADERNPEATARAIGLSSPAEQIQALATTLNGEITYIGRLALAIPDVKNWEHMLDSGGRVIREHYRVMPDEDLIKTIIYGDRAISLFAIDAHWLMSRKLQSRKAGDIDDYRIADNKLERIILNLRILNDFGDEELFEEFKNRRHNTFLSTSDMTFERIIDGVTFSAPFEPSETFERISYSAIG